MTNGPVTPRAQDRTGPLSREEMVSLLLDQFRRNGFDGVSLADIACATGIGKSSLYHHFPGGKDEMAAAVMARIESWIAEDLVTCLAAPGPRMVRIDAMLDKLAALYEDGAKPCVMASMLVGSESGPVLPAIRRAYGIWIDALQQTLEDTGAAPQAARAAACDAVARIQGALLLCRALQDRAPFLAAMTGLRETLATLGQGPAQSPPPAS